MVALRFDGLPGSIALLLDKIHSVLPLAAIIEDTTFASLLKRLKSSLASISDVIHDVVGPRRNSHGMYDWLHQLLYAVFNAEDFVDDILFEVARLKVEAKARNLESLKLRDVRASIKNLVLSQDRRPRWNIRNLVETTDAIAKAMNEYGIRKREAHDELQLSDSLPAISLLDEAAIYGREEDRINILRFLLQGDENLDGIALVDEGGLGKTTLAQLVYNDEKVSAHFELKAWVAVPMAFDLYKITRTILEATTLCSIEDLMSLELLDKLSASLDGKRFLLVLDDVQYLNNNVWYALRTSLNSGARGSKIIVTTPKEEVAFVMGCSTLYHLNPLTEDFCWSLLAKSAYAGRDRSEVITLEDIGRKIMESCRGIPLCVNVIGGLLRFKKTREEWCHVLEDLQKANNHDSISSILLLSYYHLPALLKRCFAYCSLFPRDHEFDKEELVLLWMAEGFLQKSSGPSMEMVGAECVDGLLKRSFFIPVDNSHFKIHHYMHDLAKAVSRGVCLRWEPYTIIRSAVAKRIRHLSLLCHYQLRVILEMKSLRTFYLIDCRSCQLSPTALEAIFPGLQRLRVLSLPHFQHAELPPSIGKLKYLHYLDVSHSALTSLPEYLCILYFLQTLILTNCYSLLMLPQGIVKLVNLRKLSIKGAGLKQMPEKMSRLTSLQSLTNFIVGHGGSSIKELGALPYLHGSLSVSGLQNVSSPSDASAANLKAMRYLDDLELEWSCNNEDPATDQKKVLEKLKPSVELKKLSIRFYGGKEFPRWLGDSSFSKIISLHLSDCINCKSLPPLGRLSSLEHLIIERIGRIKSIGHEFYGVDVAGCKPFQSLKTLKFVEMSQWEEWILLEVDGQEFPWLEEFCVINCSLLKRDLPKSLPTLVKLEICNCEQLEASLPQTSECCVPKLDNCDKVEKISNDNQTAPSSSEDRNQQFSSPSSSNKKLREPLDLRGSLSKSKFQDVSSASDASEANLKAMPYLDELESEKTTQDKTLSKIDGEIASEFSSRMTKVPGNELQLEWSRNNENLAKERAVRWSEVSALSTIRFLCISDYNNCSSLPPFGQLPFLENFIIQRIGGVRSIGPEFCRIDLTCRKPFQSLKTLKFGEMSQWEEWTLLEVDGEEFPCLEEFYLINCPLLKGDIPKRLPTLVKLEICECEQLEASLPQTSERCILKLDNCYKVQKKTQDKTLSKSDGEIASQFSSSMTEIPDNELQLEESRNNKNPAKEKAVQEYPEPSRKLEEPSKSDGEITPEFSPSLIHQEQDHNQPTPSPSEDGNQQLMELPTDLHSLRIEGYASDKLPKEILGRSSLQHLYIIDCISLQSFPQSPSLKTLYVHNCQKLKFPQPNKVMNQDVGLEDLCLGSSCDSLKIFALNYFPKLKSLSLWDCRNLEHLSIEKGLQNELTSLDSLEIKDCPKLRSFLEEEFQAPNLTSLVFFNCGSLKSLPGMQSIKSLQSLYINKCPALESFPVEGLPSSLIILCISFCDKITPQKGWKLENLHSLSHFEIEGGCHELESFPEEGLLPTNLNSLRISRLADLKFLDREGLQKLTSLQTLEINCCDKLDSLPEHGLPSSLYSLSITDCSLLNPKLQNRKGREWFKIARVPSIHLDEVSD
ncbi:TIR-NBS-LRR type disease resistance-like protein [Theobroma cacao]|uniref:TIR-NBS-LRR type disease resistance-like protein n=1 Tax=Theobroma cacao TaxID=3641 RepID=A0A061FRP8_THECC|nr:TIR-NBS-LRR type disease resistance-like protein [Theobroma cacao]